MLVQGRETHLPGLSMGAPFAVLPIEVLRCRGAERLGHRAFTKLSALVVAGVGRVRICG